jgi:hypothetical protein
MGAQSTLRARSLSSAELSFAWRPQNITALPDDVKDVLASIPIRPVNDTAGLPEQQRTFAQELRDAVGVSARHRRSSSPFSSFRVGNCAISRAFARLLEAPCIKLPMLSDWVGLLSGRTLGFIGDSVLRDLFVYICLVLTPLARQSYGLDRTHFGTELGGHSYAQALFRSPGSQKREAARSNMFQLIWCNHKDDTCVRNRLNGSDALVLSFGAHCTPFVGLWGCAPALTLVIARTFPRRGMATR